MHFLLLDQIINKRKKTKESREWKFVKKDSLHISLNELDQLMCSVKMAAKSHKKSTPRYNIFIINN